MAAPDAHFRIQLSSRILNQKFEYQILVYFFIWIKIIKTNKQKNNNHTEQTPTINKKKNLSIP